MLSCKKLEISPLEWPHQRMMSGQDDAANLEPWVLVFLSEIRNTKYGIRIFEMLNTKYKIQIKGWWMVMRTLRYEILNMFGRKFLEGKTSNRNAKYQSTGHSIHFKQCLEILARLSRPGPSVFF